MLFAFIGNVRAQENLPFGPENYEQDLQMFAPFDLDLDNMVDEQWSGYFFEYNKLFWTYTGERTTIGSRTSAKRLRFSTACRTRRSRPRTASSPKSSTASIRKTS